MTKRDSKTFAYLSFWLSIVPFFWIALVYLVSMYVGYAGMFFSFLIIMPAMIIFPWLEILALGFCINVVASSSKGRAYAFFGIALSTAYLVAAVLFLKN